MVVLPDVQSQHPHGDSQQSLTPLPGDPKPSSVLLGTQHTKDAGKTSILIKKRKVPDLSAILSRPSYPVLTTLSLL